MKQATLENLPLISRRSFVGLGIIACGSVLFQPKLAHGITWGGSKKTTVGSVTYTYSSGLDSGLKPTAYTKITASNSVSAGTMQAQAVMTNLFGSVIASSQWVSNRAQASSLTAQLTISRPTAGYRSRGNVNCGGRKDFCDQSPAGYSLSPGLPVNNSGQTYGTYGDVEAGAIPDLIAIVADSGLEGYALYEQFSAVDAPDSIPVYDVDGATQIGIFTFGDK